MILDSKLAADLDAIEREVKRRKKAHPFEPYATWSFVEEMAAIERAYQRDLARERAGNES